LEPLALLEKLEQRKGGKFRAANQIAVPEAAWFLEEAEEPLEAVFAHPDGGAAHGAGVEVEGGADANEDGNGELVAMIEHPALLLGSAEADPDDVGMGGVNHGADFGVFLGGERAIRGTEGAGDFVGGELTGEFDCEGVCDAGCAAIKEMARGRIPLPETEHELWAVDTTGEAKAVAAAEPDERHAVGDDEAGGGESGAELGVVAGFGDAVHAGDGNVVAGVAAEDPGLHLGDDVGDLDGVDGRAEDGEAGGGTGWCDGGSHWLEPD